MEGEAVSDVTGEEECSGLGAAGAEAGSVIGGLGLAGDVALRGVCMAATTDEGLNNSAGTTVEDGAVKDVIVGWKRDDDAVGIFMGLLGGCTEAV